MARLHFFCNLIVRAILACVCFLPLAGNAEEGLPTFRDRRMSNAQTTPEKAVEEARQLATIKLRNQLVEQAVLPRPGIFAQWALRLKGGGPAPMDFVPTMDNLRVEEIRLPEIDSSVILYQANAEFFLTPSQVSDVQMQAERYYTGQAVGLAGLLLALPMAGLAVKYAYSRADLATGGRRTVSLRWLFRAVTVLCWGLLFFMWWAF